MAYTILILLDGMQAGGLERQIVELLKGFREKSEFRMILGVLMKGGEREKEAQHYADEVLPIKRRLRYDLTLSISLLKFIDQYEIDCIHSFGSISDISAVIAGKIKNIPVINGSARSAPPYLYGRYRLSRLCMPFATWIVANSHAGLKAFKVAQNKNTSVIYNGVALSRFDTTSCGSRKESSFELCMVANFSRKKDQQALVKCLPLVLRNFPGSHLTLVGRGDKTLRNNRQLINSLKLNNDIDIVTQTDHPEPYIKRSDLCLMLTNYKVHGEGISNAIMEYMAFAKPVIATDYGGNSELIVHGKTGILVSDHTPETLANAIGKLLANNTLMEAMGLLGQERLKRKFSMERMVESYKKLYSKLIRR